MAKPDESLPVSPVTEHPDASLEKGLPVQVERTEDVVPEPPKNNLWVVMPCIGLVAFVSALDQSIISTALPTIAGELGATPSEYSWIGTSYLLAQTIMTPINGRLTDITGRKPAIYAAILFLFVFSALCGAARNVTWLIVARAFAGLGGGSIVSLSMITISDIVPLNKRGKYQGYMGASYAMAGALGPVLGGILTERTSWRWCFYINLPVCGFALVALYFSLNLPPVSGDVAELKRTFDFVGLGIIVAAVALLIVGFSTAADHGFGSPSAYGVIIAGVVVFAIAIVHFLRTKRNAIIPARMLKIRTTTFFTIGSFFNSLMLMPVAFLLPQFFQGVRGSSVISSGVQLIPFTVGIAIASTIAGEITTRTHIIRPVIWVGFSITSLGFGLFYGLFTPSVSIAVQSVCLVICSFGIGFTISTTMLVIQAAMPLEDMAAATSAWVLVRSFGATIGVAVFTAILNDGLRTKFEVIPGYGTVFQVPTNTEGYAALQNLQEGELKSRVLTAFADSFRTCWIIGCAFLAFSLVLTLFTKSYSIERGRGAAPRAQPISAPTTNTEDRKPGPEVQGLEPGPGLAAVAQSVDPVLPLSAVNSRVSRISRTGQS